MFYSTPICLNVVRYIQRGKHLNVTHVTTASLWLTWPHRWGHIELILVVIVTLNEATKLLKKCQSKFKRIRNYRTFHHNFVTCDRKTRVFSMPPCTNIFIYMKTSIIESSYSVIKIDVFVIYHDPIMLDSQFGWWQFLFQIDRVLYYKYL